MRRLAGFLLGLGVLTAVGCRSSPCEPSLWDRLFHRQPASTMMMMGDPCGCPCNKPMGMEMGYGGGPIFSAPGATPGAPPPGFMPGTPPPGVMSGPALPGGVRADTTSQDKAFARPEPYRPEKAPEKDGK
jgi:hypothetical protein